MTNAGLQNQEFTKSAGSSPRVAIIFRTHFWDDFVDRQYRLIVEKSAGLDLYVLADETRAGILAPAQARKFSVTDQQILSAGFVGAGEGSIQWFSGDVPLYLFRRSNPHYEYYIQL